MLLLKMWGSLCIDEAQLCLFVRYLTLTGDKALMQHSSHMRALAWGLARRLPRKQGGSPIVMDVFLKEKTAGNGECIYKGEDV